MNKINIGLIGLGTVGAGLVKFLQKKKSFIKNRFQTEFVIKAICDRSIQKKKSKNLSRIKLTNNYRQLINDPEIDVIVELIGGLHPAREIALGALKNGKHFVTANKSLISAYGKSLFKEAHARKKKIFYESAVMAGVPVIKTLTEGLAGNKVRGLYGIINGTCNFILSEMSTRNYSFDQALEEAQKRGFAESDPTLDINGMDSAHKLGILVNLAFGKFIKISQIHVEGITHISHDDIAFAESLDLRIKLLAIAKQVNKEIEVRVHPTLISDEHPLATINGIDNAIFINTDPLGDILLSGEGAGQMAAASGVVSDLVNLSANEPDHSSPVLGNIYKEASSLEIRKIDEVSTKFYLRFMAKDKPGVLSKITGVLGSHGIGINSVTQRQHNKAAIVPVVILTEAAPEKNVRQALEKIRKLPTIKGKPVAIRMEKLS